MTTPTAHSQQIHIHKMANGMVVLGEVMPWLESAAFSFSVPSGCRFDPADRPGLANFASEMVQRGCGDLNSRDFIEKLESLGVDYGSSVSVYNSHFSGAMPAERLIETMHVYRDLLRAPWLPEAQFEDGRLVCLQEIRALDDDLSQRVLLQLRLRQYGQPFGRWSQGSVDGVNATTPDDVAKFVADFYQPQGVILAVAGRIEWPRLIESVESLFGDWKGQLQPSPTAFGQQRGVLHIPFESQQVHIGLAFPSVTYADPDYFLARAAVGALSDGMSSRLFTELREKRGLCYTVFASLHSILDQACVVGYVGTGTDRAQQSLDALVEQFDMVTRGIGEDELARLKVQIRSSLVMQQESSRSRASSMAGDWMHLGRVRTLEEINQTVNDLTTDRINDWLATNPPRDFNLVTLGPEPLELNHAVSSTGTR